MTASDADDDPERPRRGLLSIGHFSRVTGLTVKTIRLYHERGLLPPAFVDPASGYRHFGQPDVERARLIGDLRRLEFSLAEIGELLGEYDGDAGALAFLEAHGQRIAARRQHLRRVARELERLIRAEKEALARANATPHGIVERDLAPLLVGGLRWTGRYADSGEALGRVCRRFGREAEGAPLNLYYDLEYKEEDAEIESCVPLRRAREAPGFTVRTLPGVRAVCMIHQGPYGELSRSYARLVVYLEEHGQVAGLPIREIYRRGPGLIFRGNPRRYLTEIQIPLAD
jgi:DNA-binding transcriptional MerR regulator